MQDLERDSILNSALNRGKWDGISTFKIRLEADKEKFNWPNWFEEDGEYIQSSGFLSSLRNVRRLLLTEFDDAKLVLVRRELNWDNLEKIPMSLLLWNNQERTRKWSTK